MGGGDNKIDETEAEKAQAQVAAQRWNDYKGSFQQYENKFMQEVDGLNDQSKYQRVTELAVSPIARQFAQEGANITRQMNASGVNPNSGKSALMRSGINDAQANSEVGATSRASSSQQDNYVAGLQNVAAIGQGQAAQSMQGLSTVAQTANAYARSEAQDAFQDRSNVQQGVGLAIGAGTRYGMEQTDNG